MAKTRRVIGRPTFGSSTALQTAPTAPIPTGRFSAVPRSSAEGLLVVLVATAVLMDVVLTAVLAPATRVPRAIVRATPTGAEGPVPSFPVAPVQIVPSRLSVGLASTVAP